MKFKLLLSLLLTLVFACASILLKTNASFEQVKVQISNAKQEKPNNEFTLISTGDIGLVRDVNYQIIVQQNTYYPFLNIASYLKASDLTIINLEGPLIENCPVIREGFTFCGKRQNVEGLVYAGIDGANLANNHTTNYGLDGLVQTSEILQDKNIIPYGLDGEIGYLKINGNKIALVGFVELENNWSGLNNATIENVSMLIKKAKKNANIVIASFHWGVEYTRKPTNNQTLLAHLAIDNGADLILGNHPHWIQTSEIYKGKFITYAQGNTIFDQDWSQETKEGVLYKFRWENDKFNKIEEKYTIIENNSQPRFANPNEVKEIIAKIK